MKKVEMHDRKIPFLYQTREEFWAELHKNRRQYRKEMDRLLGRRPGEPLLYRYMLGRKRPEGPVDSGDQQPDES